MAEYCVEAFVPIIHVGLQATSKIRASAKISSHSTQTAAYNPTLYACMQTKAGNMVIVPLL